MYINVTYSYIYTHICIHVYTWYLLDIVKLVGLFVCIFCMTNY